jgi:hypothetical protein
VCEEFAIATHAGIAPVKDRRFINIIGMREPVPVLAMSDMDQPSMKRFDTHGLVAFVTALVSKGLLVRPYEVAVPGKKETIAMYKQGLVHVDSDKVIETSLCCRRPCFIGYGW